MAIRRDRGGRPLTTSPPMRTSPSVGCSSPAIIRSSVVLPQPEAEEDEVLALLGGQVDVVDRRTLTAAEGLGEADGLDGDCHGGRRSACPPTSPCDRQRSKMPWIWLFGLRHLRLGSFSPRRLGQHRGDHVRAEHLADGGLVGPGMPMLVVHVTTSSKVMSPSLSAGVEPKGSSLIQASRLGALDEGREVVQPGVVGGVGVVGRVVEEELLGRTGLVACFGTIQL